MAPPSVALRHYAAEPVHIDPMVSLLVETFQKHAAQQDERQADLVAAFERRDLRRDEKQDELIETFAARDEQHNKQIADIVKVVGALTVEVKASGVAMDKIAAAVPARKELWALGTVLCVLLMVFVGLYAQANGHDAGKALEDAKGLIPLVGGP